MSPNAEIKSKVRVKISKKVFLTSIVVCILILGLIASNVFLWQKISSQQSSITSINEELSNQSPDLSSEVTSLQSQYNGLEGSVSDANSQIQDVIDCVNAYMKVVGNSAGEAYQYRFC